MKRPKATVCARRVERKFLNFLVIASAAALVILLTTCLLVHRSISIVEENRLLQEETDLQEQHKNLFPFSTRDALGFVLASLGLMLAAGGGIGGGGILVPIYILILNFPAKHAIPLSNVTVFGGAVANTILNVRKRHPLADRPLIDWNIIMIMEPFTILGSLLGANLNKLLPEKVIVILLVILLSLTACKTLRKAVKLYETETYFKVDDTDTSDKENHQVDLVELGTTSPTLPVPKRSLSRGASSDSGTLTNARLLQQGYLFRRSSSVPLSTVHDNVSDETPPESRSVVNTPKKYLNSESSLGLDVQACTNSIEVLQSRNPNLVRILEEERRFSVSYVCSIVGLFLFVLIINILKGGGAFPSPLGIECGSLSFWIAQATIALVICVFDCKARSSLLHRTRLKRDAGYQYLESDIEWNEHSTVIYPLLSGFAGFTAGLFGIGGGIVKGPLMLALGVHPAVASATSACMILFTSFTATTSFAVFGLLVPDYGWFCLLTGFVATLVGQTIMSMVIERHQRCSYIAFCIGGVVMLSAICMTVESAISINKGKESGLAGGICSTHFE